MERFYKGLRNVLEPQNLLPHKPSYVKPHIPISPIAYIQCAYTTNMVVCQVSKP